MKNKRIDFEVSDSAKYLELFESLRLRQFSLKDVGISARIHNNWRKSGVIPYAEDDGKWATYDFFQFLWLQIVKDLRIFGLPLEFIGEVKDFLFRNIQDDIVTPDEKLEPVLNGFISRIAGQDIQSKIITSESIAGAKKYIENLFQGYVLNFIMFRGTLTFYFYLDGFVDIWDDLTLQIHPEKKPSILEPHIALPLSHYFSGFLGDATKSEFLTTIPILSQEEKEVLQALRNNQLKELTVKFIDEGKSRRMDILTKVDEAISEEKMEAITKILGLKSYESIVLKKHNGSKLYFEREKRKKI